MDLPRHVVGLVIVAALCCASPPSAGAGPESSTEPAVVEELPPEVDTYVRKALADWSIPGMAVAVVRRGEIRARGYGVRELGRPEPVGLHTVFDAASLTKSFTSTLVAMLVDEGKMAWDEPVRTYLPLLDLGDPYLTQNATVRDFLAHRTGLPPANSLWVLTGLDRGELLARLRCLSPAAPFRSRWLYNNLGYTVVGEAIAAATGASWEDLVSRRLLEPLGLRDSTASYDEGMRRPDHATSHAWIDAAQRPLRLETRRPAIAPAASVMSSIADLARWARFHLTLGETGGKRLVSEAALRETQSPQVIIATTPEMRAARQVEFFGAYGMGWQIMDYRGRPLLWHTGAGDGQMVYMALLPKDDLAVVVLVNTFAADHVHLALASWLIDFHLGLPRRDWSGEAHERHLAAFAKGGDPLARLLAGASEGPPPRALADYAATYESCPWGPIHVRAEGEGLVLQLGSGEVADLRHHHDDSFAAIWRDPLYRSDRSTMVEFTFGEGGRRSLHLAVGRDDIDAATQQPEATRPGGGTR